ncbi:amidase (plasmid) [Rhizobium bangladeshense]|uniref:amidase n=1 Tax=Rhizobium TaxID=379 RepID=UPI001A991FA5|nr:MULTISPECIES: amidase [Rhizobium]MBX5139189.1 amidase [Rhizobium lentis]MBX5272556.1 amidase [Rhizobium sp. NLR17b]MBX5299961.1 amidase [Rhizobium sp. NLR12b]QSY97631.1 amidase [Rhizobium bangladeshense]
MRLNEYVEFDATGLASLVDSGEVSSMELTHLAREAYEQINPTINAVVEFYDDAETVAAADAGPFNGVPFLRKDIGPTEAGRLQEMGSRLFKGNRPETESFFFRRARDAGLRIVGRTTTTEFGTSGMSESMLHGVTRNPWDVTRTTGGSSAGAAAAVAAGITPIAHGGDGGGSIRIPASWCGLVGLNPSRGRISGGPNNQDGSFGLSRPFVLCRTVRDMAAALDVFSGPHAGDPFIIAQPIRRYSQELSQATGRLRVGVARTKWGAVDIEPQILCALESAASLLLQFGHSVADVEPPYESADYTKILLAGSCFTTRWLDGAAREFGRNIDKDTVEEINLKLYALGRDRGNAGVHELHEALRRMRFAVGEAIEDFDILLTPTMPISAPPHGGIYATTNPTLSAEEYLAADAALYQYLGVFNVTGQPSVSLPLAQSNDGLPIGLQIVGRFGDEATLVRLARDLEEAEPWNTRRPNAFAVEKC